VIKNYYKVDLDGEVVYASGAQTDASELNNRSRGETISISLTIPQPTADLNVASGETYVVEAGTIEFYDDSVNEGTIDVNGVIVYYGNAVNFGTVDDSDGVSVFPDENPFKTLLSYDRHAGSYALSDTLNNTQRYHERLPGSANISSLLVGIEPSPKLKSEFVGGVWGLISNVTDNRSRALTNPVVTLEIDILAEYSEYNDVAAVRNDLEI